MTRIPLDSKMENGASVSDWLGTAGVAASVASASIDAIRVGGRPPIWSSDDPLAFVIRKLEAALDEVKAVQAHVTRIGNAEAERAASAALRERVMEWLREAPREWYSSDDVHAALDHAVHPLTREEVARAMPMGDDYPFGGFPVQVGRGKGGATVYRLKEGR